MPYNVNRLDVIIALTGALMFIIGFIVLTKATILKTTLISAFLLTWSLMIIGFAFLDIVKQDKQ